MNSVHSNDDHFERASVSSEHSVHTADLENLPPNAQNINSVGHAVLAKAIPRKDAMFLPGRNPIPLQPLSLPNTEKKTNALAEKRLPPAEVKAKIEELKKEIPKLEASLKQLEAKLDVLKKENLKLSATYTKLATQKNALVPPKETIPTTPPKSKTTSKKQNGTPYQRPQVPLPPSSQNPQVEKLHAEADKLHEKKEVTTAQVQEQESANQQLKENNARLQKEVASLQKDPLTTVAVQDAPPLIDTTAVTFSSEDTPKSAMQKLKQISNLLDSSSPTKGIVLVNIERLVNKALDLPANGQAILGLITKLRSRPEYKGNSSPNRLNTLENQVKSKLTPPPSPELKKAEKATPTPPKEMDLATARTQVYNLNRQLENSNTQVEFTIKEGTLKVKEQGDPSPNNEELLTAITDLVNAALKGSNNAKITSTFIENLRELDWHKELTSTQQTQLSNLLSHAEKIIANPPRPQAPPKTTNLKALMAAVGLGNKNIDLELRGEAIVIRDLKSTSNCIIAPYEKVAALIDTAIDNAEKSKDPIQKQQVQKFISNLLETQWGKNLKASRPDDFALLQTKGISLMPKNQQPIAATRAEVGVAEKAFEHCSKDPIGNSAPLAAVADYFKGSANIADGIRQLEGSVTQAGREVACNYNSFTPVNGDGDCYYRSVMYGYIEDAIRGDRTALTALSKMLSHEDVTKHLSDPEKKSNQVLIDFLGNLPPDKATALTVFKTAMNEGGLDAPLVKGLRHLIANDMIEQAKSNQDAWTASVVSTNSNYNSAEAFCNAEIRGQGNSKPYAPDNINFMNPLSRILGVNTTTVALTNRAGSNIAIIESHDLPKAPTLHLMLVGQHYGVLHQKESTASSSTTGESKATPNPTTSPSTDQAKAFNSLQKYIQSEYPEFKNISDYQDINSFQEKGHPLHFAAQKNDSKLLIACIEAGADPQQKDEEGDTALDFLMKGSLLNTKMKQMIDYLLTKGLKPSVSDSSFKSPIACLIERGHQRNKEWLNDIISKVITNENRAEIAHAIVENRCLPNDLVVSLLEKGMPVDTPDKDGRSLLYKAVDRMDKELAATLIKYKANPNLAGTIQRRDTPSNIPGNRTFKQKSFTPLTPLELAKGKQEQLENTLENMEKLKVVSQKDLNTAEAKEKARSKERIEKLPGITPQRKLDLKNKVQYEIEKDPALLDQEEEIAKLKKETAEKLHACKEMVTILSATPPEPKAPLSFPECFNQHRTNDFDFSPEDVTQGCEYLKAQTNPSTTQLGNLIGIYSELRGASGISSHKKDLENLNEQRKFALEKLSEEEQKKGNTDTVNRIKLTIIGLNQKIANKQEEISNLEAIEKAYEPYRPFLQEQLDKPSQAPPPSSIERLNRANLQDLNFTPEDITEGIEYLKAQSNPSPVLIGRLVAIYDKLQPRINKAQSYLQNLSTSLRNELTKLHDINQRKGLQGTRLDPTSTKLAIVNLDQDVKAQKARIKKLEDIEKALKPHISFLKEKLANSPTANPADLKPETEALVSILAQEEADLSMASVEDIVLIFKDLNNPNLPDRKTLIADTYLIVEHSLMSGIYSETPTLSTEATEAFIEGFEKLSEENPEDSGLKFYAFMLRTIHTVNSLKTNLPKNSEPTTLYEKVMGREHSTKSYNKIAGNIMRIQDDIDNMTRHMSSVRHPGTRYQNLTEVIKEIKSLEKSMQKEGNSTDLYNIQSSLKGIEAAMNLSMRKMMSSVKESDES